mgnify:CR=1 FL=1
MPDDIGGRYSVLTAVGLLPIAVAGVDIDELMGGAADMMKVCEEKAGYDCPSWQYAAIRYELYRSGRSIELLGCYDHAFRFMAEWWKQLFGESEGKDDKGLYPASVEFTADLHSMGQYIQQGRRLMFETIVRLGPSNCQLTVPMDGKSARDLGQLIYFFEYGCGLSGYLIDVNPFDQPGVEAYKQNMFALLGKPGYEDRKAELEAKLAK